MAMALWKILLLVISLTQGVLSISRAENACSDLEGVFPDTPAEILANEPTVRRVDPNSGVNSQDCLDAANYSTAQPCATLHYAIHGNEDPNNRTAVENIVIYLAEGNYSLVGGLWIINSENVSIIGAQDGPSVLQCGSYGVDDELQPCFYENLQIRNSFRVYTFGLTFTQCGPVSSAAYVVDSEIVVFQNCSFRDTISPPVLLYNSPSVAFIETTFSNNHPAFLSEEILSNPCYFPGGNNLFLLDNRTSSGGISYYTDKYPARLLISQSTFYNNSARLDSSPAAKSRTTSVYGFGGALYFRLVSANNSRVCISDTTFESNTAGGGGGAIIAALAHFATRNQITVIKSTFVNNRCSVLTCIGGAIGVDMLLGTQYNEFLISESNFTGNEAESGGAIVLATSVGSTTSPDGIADSLVLDSCTFESNQAFYEGTAVAVFSFGHLDQIGFPLNITNCQFTANAGSQGSADTTALLVYQVLASFSGVNDFSSNAGGGLTLIGSRMDVLGEVNFDGNSAVFGAGIAMSGRSLLLFYSGATMLFLDNFASEEGGGMYVEYPSRDFILSVLNRGCFLQYFSDTLTTSHIDIPPNEWNVSISFINNTAGLGGAAIYANDMSRCKWLGPEAKDFSEQFFIFSTPSSYRSPFFSSNNNVRVTAGTVGGVIEDHSFGTDASSFSAVPEFNASSSTVSFGESVSFKLSSVDQFKNFRQSVWSVNVPLESQPLGALSSNNSIFIYDVPSQSELSEVVEVANGTANIEADFSLLGSQADSFTVSLLVRTCHPGYEFNEELQQCQCLDELREIVRCDTFDRYFYARDGTWVGVREDNTTYFSSTVPGFLNCTRQGSLPGCLFKFDFPEEQCAAGRTGVLCGDCEDGYGVTFDLRFCQTDCGAGGIVIFVVICIGTLVLSFLVLYYDIQIPDELKGVIFFAQVIGIVYRNTPYLQGNQGQAGYAFFDFLINMLGFAMPIPVCLWENLPALGVAFLGFVPPVIATVTAIFYIICANRVRFLSHRTEYGFHGFYFLSFFVYKYLLDTGFIFVSCTFLDGSNVFIYQGSVNCYAFPFLILLILGNILLISLGVVLPAYILYILYQPKKAPQVSDALTVGFKKRRRYRWYSVWDIWRRLLFVAANLFISFTTRSVVLFIHCLLILICLTVVCVVKPYKKAHVNVTEALMILALFGATLAILDENDIHVKASASYYFIAFPFLYGLLFICYSLWCKADERWGMNAWLRDTARPATDWLMAIMRKIMPAMLSEESDYEEEDKGKELQERTQSTEGTEEDEEGDPSVFREPLIDDDPTPSQ